LKDRARALESVRVRRLVFDDKQTFGGVLPEDRFQQPVECAGRRRNLRPTRPHALKHSLADLLVADQLTLRGWP
jgi:hypothetical protein